MEPSTKQISESEFKKLEIPILFMDESIDRAFGVISSGEKKYKLGWQSETIQPVIKCINAILCTIGIDLVFIIIQLNTDRILKKISLDYYFYDTKIFNGAIYVITQLEIIKIKIADLEIERTYPLPDYFDSIEFNEGDVLVKCIGNQLVKI